MYKESALDALPNSSLLPGLILLVALTHLAVGASAFHPSPFSIELLTGLRRLKLPGRLEGFILELGL